MSRSSSLDSENDAIGKPDYFAPFASIGSAARPASQLPNRPAADQAASPPKHSTGLARSQDKVARLVLFIASGEQQWAFSRGDDITLLEGRIAHGAP
jgi:hypothetical protein